MFRVKSLLNSSLLVRFKRFLMENPGAGFVLGFQVLLVSCAVLLAVGWSVIAEGVAVVAYFMLAAGVLVQLVWYVRHRDKNGE
jgi:hypothetical protein